MGHSFDATNDVIKPLVSSALIEPLNTVTETVNRASSALGGGDLFERVHMEYTRAEAYSPEWFTQNMMSGVGAIVPYTIAGKLAGGAMRGVGARMELSGSTAALLQSERTAAIVGAFAYDGLRPLHEGETRFGNAMGGAAGFLVFGAGNDWSKGFSTLGKVSARVGTGFLGGNAQLMTSSLIGRGEIPKWEELMEAGVSGASMNVVLPTVQEYSTRKITELQTNSRFGAPAQRYLDVFHGGAATPELQTLLSQNPWARVRVSDHADFSTQRNMIDVSRVQVTPGAVAKGLEHLSAARQQVHESGFRNAASELQVGNVEQAWNNFRTTRATQELNAHQTENRVDSSKGYVDRLVPEHMAMEIGAWPAPGGVSYEYRWRQEFQQFQQSQGKWRPGEKLTDPNQKFEPNKTEDGTTRSERLTEQQKALADLEAMGTKLVTDLQKEGHLAVFAGGSVRDKLMGGTPKDFDIATRATPDQVIALFEGKGYKVIPTGKQFGVINVVADGKQFEIATLRNDGQYTDGRRPDGVRHVNSLWEDAARRDLTINAMFQDPTTRTVYDFFGGKQDISNKIIRTVGDPVKRFEEDRLRMMRVPRFASRYEGFTVDPATRDAIAAQAHQIHAVSPERIVTELRGILTSKQPLTGLDFMMETGLMREVLPEVHALTGPKAMQDPVWHPEGSTWNHTRLVVNNLTGSRWETMLSGLLHDIGKPATQKVWEDGGISNYGHAEVGADMSRAIMNRFKMSNAEKDMVVKLVADHMKMHTVQEWRRGKLATLLNSPYIDEHIALQHADATGTARTDGHGRSNRDWLFGKKAEFAAETNTALALGAKPLIDGRMLIDMGVKPGPKLGEIKTKALEAQGDGVFTDAASANRWLLENYPELAK